MLDTAIWRTCYLLIEISLNVECSPNHRNPGHEDLDQIFSIQASLIARHEFNTPEELMQIMDSASRPERQSEAMRKAQKTNFNVDCECKKLDECAEWQQWVAMLGIRLKGLRALACLE